MPSCRSVLAGLLALASSSFLGCDGSDRRYSDDAAAGRDATVVRADAGSPDARLPSPDAALPPADGGTQPDASPAADAAVPSDAAVSADATAGRDAAVPPDATTTPDASPRPDAGTLARPNVIPNGSFEEWTNGLPVSWLGDQNNATADSVAPYTTSAHDGVKSCQLTNTSATHKRFTTRPMSLPAGRYDCTYWVRGHGEVRTGYYDNDFSSYSPSGYHQVNSTEWASKTYGFTLTAAVADTFELIFSFRNTQSDLRDLQLDDVQCARRPEPCDTVTCDEWAVCNNATVLCEAKFGRCVDGLDCLDWQECAATHTCLPAPGRCRVTLDCSATVDTPVCDTATHTCVAGDPCAGVSCQEWMECNPASGTCVRRQGFCDTTADCLGDAPTCDWASHHCESADHPANIVVNGGFETWSDYDVPYQGTHLLPDGWYGLDIPGSTEIPAANVRPYTTSAHSGTTACQLISTGIAQRFTTEIRNVPLGRFTCAYWVRGRGVVRHRTYSSRGWNPYTDFVNVDGDTWVPLHFNVDGAARDWRLILYPGSTDAAKDHIQVDDVVCSLDP